MSNKPHILVIEDEPELLDLLASELSASGFQVTTARNGEEGYSKALEQKPDAILCDIMMPVMDGYEFLRRIRTNHRTLDMVPILFLTAKNDAKDQKLGLSLGVDDYLTKPFDFELLIIQIWSRINQMQRIRERHDAQMVKVYRALMGQDDPEIAESEGGDAPIAHVNEGQVATVAVVSSEVSERTVLATLAKSQKFNVYQSASGESLIRDFGTIRPSILFLSERTSDLAGFYVARNLKSETGDALPIVMLCGAMMEMSDGDMLPPTYDGYFNLSDGPDRFLTLMEMALPPLAVE